MQRDNVTALLQGWTDGDDRALERLTPFVQAELRRIAGRYMAGERVGHTLQASALVNEAFLKLVDIRRIQWQNVSTVVSAAILIGAEVFGAAFAGGWALANLFNLGLYGEYVLTAAFVLIGIVVMAGFIRNGMRVEPFTARQ